MANPETPDYELIRNHLKDTGKTMRISLDKIEDFDWEKERRAAQRTKGHIRSASQYAGKQNFQSKLMKNNKVITGKAKEEFDTKKLVV